MVIYKVVAYGKWSLAGGGRLREVVARRQKIVDFQQFLSLGLPINVINNVSLTKRS